MSLTQNHRANPDGGRKRTIGLVVPSFEDTGGVPTVAEFILRAISRRPDFQARVISLATSASDDCSLLIARPSTWGRGVVTRSGHCHGHDFVHVGANLGEIEFQRLQPRAPLARLLRGCDLIQVVAGAPSWALPVVGLGAPVLLQVATLTAVERRSRARANRGAKALWRRAMTQVTARLDEQALRQVDAVMVENPWMEAHARAANAGRPTRVIYAPPGVDTALFQPAAERSVERPYILAVGRFSDVRKNPLLLLETYRRVVACREDAPDLLLAGFDGPPEVFWQGAREAGLADRIRFESRPDGPRLAELYRNAACLAVPSDEEGFGIVVIEAMASATPVVSTRSGGPDGIITDGVDGYLVEIGDADALADRLCRLIADPAHAQSIGLAGLETVRRRYADEVAGDVYLNAYDSLLEQVRPA